MPQAKFRASVSGSGNTTTSLSFNIPSTVSADDDLYVFFTSRDHTAGTALVTCTDNDTNDSGIWDLVFVSADRKAYLFHKKANALSFGKTVTLSGAVGSCTGGLTAFYDCELGDPTTNIVSQTNAPGVETHAGFTPDYGGSMIVFVIYNITRLESISTVTSANLGSFGTLDVQHLSAGGSDCSTYSASLPTPDAISDPHATGSITWSQTNADTITLSFAVRPLAPHVPIARITQAPTLVLTETEGGEARITQVSALVLGEIGQLARITQSAILVLASSVPCITRWSQCWKITRVDGLVFAFTDHDVEIMFNGVLHSPCNSLSASASELGSVLGSVGNLELTGLISDESITETDLIAGKFDGAEVEIWMVPWINDGGEIPYRLSAGVVGNISQGLNSYNMEALTQGARLQQQALLQQYMPSCRFELGDFRCTVDLIPLTVTGSVTALSTLASFNLEARRTFMDSSRAEADRYFELGTITWLTGPNAGQSSEIKDFSGGVFVLWQPTVFAIGFGDTYEAIPGCDKIHSTCINKYNNLINFGGFKDVPGKDAMMQSPDSKAG